MKNNIQTVPLFAKPLYMDKILLSKEEETFIRKDVEKINFQNTHLDSEYSENTSLISPDLRILDSEDYIFLKDKIFKSFKYMLEEIYGYDTEFKLSTSWFTKTEKGASSGIHKHNNCMFSAVFYPLDMDINSSILFHERDASSFCLESSKPESIIGKTDIQIKASQYDFIVFPSNTYHSIKKHTSSSPRYSIAMNFFPIGVFDD